MSNSTILLIFMILFSSCKEKSNSQAVSTLQLSNNINELLLDTKEYKPSTVDLSKEEFLNDYDIESILEANDNSESKKDLIVNLILLKQYLYHLRNSNQGYDLKSMMKNNAKPIIDYFLKRNEIDSSLEFINSAVAYNILKKDKSITNRDLMGLIVKIDNEDKRIIEQSKKIINDN